MSRGYWEKFSLGVVRGYKNLFKTGRSREKMSENQILKEKLLHWLEKYVLGHRLSWAEHVLDQDLTLRIAICRKVRNGTTYFKVLYQLAHYPLKTEV